MFATTIIDQLKTPEAGKDKHAATLLNKIAKDLQVPAKNIIDFALNLVDTQGAALGGFNKEFLYASKLDNLTSTITAVDSIIEMGAEASDGEIPVAFLFDHEEVGSQSA